MLPFTKTPILEAPPIPPKKLNGIDITKAQGQDTTTNDKALADNSKNVDTNDENGRNKKLETILSNIKGVGKVKVLITYSQIDDIDTRVDFAKRCGITILSDALLEYTNFNNKQPLLKCVDDVRDFMDYIDL